MSEPTTRRKCHMRPLTSAAATLAACLMLCTPAAATQTLTPLPASNYSVRSMCSQPALGKAGCMSMELVPVTPAARAHSHPIGRAIAAAANERSASEACTPPTAAEACFGLRPIDLHDAYELPSLATSSQTIALVDAYNDPTIEADLKTYDEEFGLKGCEAENHCLEVVNEHGVEGSLPFPKTAGELKAKREGSPAEAEEAEEAEGWSVEISLDVETAHAVCENCKILLVEANTASFSDLDTAELSAVSAGASEISNSWGAPECVINKSQLECAGEERTVFAHKGIVTTVSAGDNGYQDWDSNDPGYADFPASSPAVVAVGGTRLTLNAEGEWAGETVWNDGGKSGGSLDGHGAGGGGCTKQLAAPTWQRSLPNWSSVGCGSHRAVADVAADADPYSGLAVRDSSSESCVSEFEEETIEHWCTIGGTSLASPLIASVFALAGGAQGLEYPARMLYANELATPSSLHDVTQGSNGECAKPFNEGTGQSGCTSAEQAAASCSSHASCLAGTGYDGPTGVGTPRGLEAFELPAGGFQEQEEKEEAGKERTRTLGAGETSASAPPPSSGAGLLTEVGSSSGVSANGLTLMRLSGLALTVKAIIALNRSRPRLPQLSFTFVSNTQARVRVTLQRLVSKHHHSHWQAFGRTQEIQTTDGRNTQRLSGHSVLHAGAYRLTLTPAYGAARSIVFRIG